MVPVLDDSRFNPNQKRGRAHDPGVTYLKRALAYANRRTCGQYLLV